MMDIGYRIYQAERALSSAEQRAVDTAIGELAESFARRWDGVATRVGVLRTLLSHHSLS